MQATQPIRHLNAAAAALAAIVLAAVVVTAVIAVAIASGFAPPDAGSGTTTQAAPLILDPDARDAGARHGNNVLVPQ